MTCRVLIDSRDADWSSQTGESILGASWVCVISEELYHLDLDFPQTGIHLIQDRVPLPTFFTSTESSQTGVEWPSYYQYQFLAFIILRRLIISIDAAVHECTSSIDYDSSRHKLTVSQHLRLEQSPRMTTVVRTLD